jgi:hypothetical protein
MSTLSPAAAPRLIAKILVAPSRGLDEASGHGSVVPSLLVATLATLLHAAVLSARLDVRPEVAAPIPSADKPAPTPHEEEEALASARKLATARVYVTGALAPSCAALVVGLALWLGFAVSSRPPPLRATLSVASSAQLPLAAAALLSIPALLTRHAVTRAELVDLLPSHLAVLLGPERTGPWVHALESVDLFSLWALGLVILGMRTVAGTSLARSAATTVVLWLSYVAVFHVALPALSGGG